VNTNDLALPKQDRMMQTKPLPNMLRARIAPPPQLLEVVRIGEVLDFPAEEVHLVTKAAFNAALLIKIQLTANRAF
jgi:hypothetical protein